MSDFVNVFSPWLCAGLTVGQPEKARAKVPVETRNRTPAFVSGGTNRQEFLENHARRMAFVRSERRRLVGRFFGHWKSGHSIHGKSNIRAITPAPIPDG